MNKTILSTLVSAALLTAAAAPALAQSAGPGAGPQARHHAQRQHDEQRASRLPSERIEARLAYLKTALKITDAQQAQWDTFAATLRKHASEADQQVQTARAEAAARSKGTRPTAIERMERSQTRLSAAYTRMSETLAAAKPLYAALSPEQQKTADELLTPRRREGGFRHGGGRPRA
jgi:hypothetical protein